MFEHQYHAVGNLALIHVHVLCSGVFLNVDKSGRGREEGVLGTYLEWESIRLKRSPRTQVSNSSRYQIRDI